MVAPERPASQTPVLYRSQLLSKRLPMLLSWTCSHTIRPRLSKAIEVSVRCHVNSGLTGLRAARCVNR